MDILGLRGDKLTLRNDRDWLKDHVADYLTYYYMYLLVCGRLG